MINLKNNFKYIDIIKLNVLYFNILLNFYDEDWT